MPGAMRRGPRPSPPRCSVPGYPTLPTGGKGVTGPGGRGIVGVLFKGGARKVTTEAFRSEVVGKL